MRRSNLEAAGDRDPQCLQRMSEECNSVLSPDSSARDGRRIYIHERSLVRLAENSESSAELVYGMLAKMIIMKIAHHVLEEDSVALGLVRKDRATALSSSMQNTWAQDVSRALRGIGLKGKTHLSVAKLLDEEEDISATCYFSGYLTFATSDRAAIRMFADSNDISEVLRIQRAGEGYKDLLLIKGNRLKVIALEIQDRPKPKKLRPLSQKEIETIKARVFGSVRSEFVATAKRAMLQPDPMEQRAIQKVEALFVQTLSRGIFAMSSAW